MATNQIHERGVKLSLPVASGVSSGDPAEVGQMTGVALHDRGLDITGEATVQSEGVFDLSTKGINDDGNVAIAIGDPLYYVDGDTPKISAKASGKPFGFALEAVSSGATDTIKVRLQSTPKSILKIALVAGGSAGNHTVTGVALGDRLVSVVHLSTAASIATAADITSEFSISAANTINNTGGTDTTSDQLMVFYEDRT